MSAGLFGVLLGVAAAYQLLALFAAWRFHGRRSTPALHPWPPVSILKPIHGIDRHLQEALTSQLRLDYPEYEVLAGVRPQDSAARALVEELPGLRLVWVQTRTPNGKVGALIDLAAAAQHDILVISDSDITVPPDYLKIIVAELSQPGIGLVTCLYGASGDTLASRAEALGVATDFAPSVLVARLLGINDFALGSTLALRRSDLQRLGGFQALSDYLADDYQLGRQIRRLGLKIEVSRAIVETHLAGSWSAVHQHQLRWARTVRVCQPAGYVGSLITHATLWACLAATVGYRRSALVLLALRLAAGYAVGAGILRSAVVRRWWWLMPLRDLWGTIIWLQALFGRRVLWRGQRLMLDGEGRILRLDQAS